MILTEFAKIVQKKCLGLNLTTKPYDGKIFCIKSKGHVPSDGSAQRRQLIYMNYFFLHRPLMGFQGNDQLIECHCNSLVGE